MRWALGVEYDGTAYHGWQSQHEIKLATVQRCLEHAISQIADESVAIVCAGRTDKGVHATNQVIHFDSERQRDARAWVAGVNSGLPADIRILWAQPVAADFHARFSALSRRYRYIIYNHPIRPAIARRQFTWYPYPLDSQKMQEAALYLLGEHDFSAFRGADCQAKTTQRCVQQFEVKHTGVLIEIVIQANAFLHHMVRNIAGVLLEIGEGKRPAVWAQQVLLGKSRKLGGITAPPQGLYLVNVHYPAHFAIPQAQDLPLIFNDAHNRIGECVN